MKWASWLLCFTTITIAIRHLRRNAARRIQICENTKKEEKTSPLVLEHAPAYAMAQQGGGNGVVLSETHSGRSERATRLRAVTGLPQAALVAHGLTKP